MMLPLLPIPLPLLRHLLHPLTLFHIPWLHSLLFILSLYSPSQRHCLSLIRLLLPIWPLLILSSTLIPRPPYPLLTTRTLQLCYNYSW